MTNERVAKTIYKWKSYATRLKGRPRVRWEDDVRNDLRKMGVSNRKQRTQERMQWKEIIVRKPKLTKSCRAERRRMVFWNVPPRIQLLTFRGKLVVTIFMVGEGPEDVRSRRVQKHCYAFQNPVILTWSTIKTSQLIGNSLF
jgi:hypothetical protein